MYKNLNIDYCLDYQIVMYFVDTLKPKYDLRKGYGLSVDGTKFQQTTYNYKIIMQSICQSTNLRLLTEYTKISKVATEFFL